MKVLDNLIVSGTISKVGGTSTQFLKADGSLDPSVYVTGTPWSGQYLPLAGGTLYGDLTTPKLLIGSGAFLANSYFRIGQSLNAHIQGNINNTNAGTLASSDWVATANNGTDTANFINFGINSSVNADPAWTMAGANDGYLFTNGGHLTIGTASVAKHIKFFTGGTLAANEKARIFGATGNVTIGYSSPTDDGFKLDVNGTARLQGVTTLTNLSGAGSRFLRADANGVLSAAANPTTLAGYGITDAITGSGTANKVVKYLTSTTIGSSTIFDNGTVGGIGVTGTPTAKWEIDSGTADLSGLKLTKLPQVLNSVTTVITATMYGIQMASDGRLFYIKNNLVYVLSADGITETLYDGTAYSSDGIGELLLLPNGEIIVGRTGGVSGNAMYKIPVGGGSHTNFTTSVFYTSKMCLLPNGDILSTTPGSNLVHLTPSGGGTSTVYVTGATNLQFGNMSAYPDGRVLISSQVDNTIYVIPYGGGSMSVFSTSITAPSSIKIFNNKVFVVSSNTNLYSIDNGITVLLSNSIANGFGGMVTNDGITHYIMCPASKIQKTISSNAKVLTTDANGLLVKTTYLEDVKYVKPSDLTGYQVAGNYEPIIPLGTPLQYYSGNKTFQTLNTLAVPELTNLYYTNARGIGSVLTGFASGAGTVVATDTILQAIQKLNGNTGNFVDLTTNQSITGSKTFNSILLGNNTTLAQGAIHFKTPNGYALAAGYVSVLRDNNYLGIVTAANSNIAKLDTVNLSTNRIFSFPNKDGMFAMTSDLTGLGTPSWSSVTSKPTTLSGFGITDGAKSLGTADFAASTTTAAFLTDLSNKGFLTGGFTTGKGSWSYAGNSDISDTGFGAFELAGASLGVWNDGTNRTVLAIAPNTGAAAGQVLIYNDQGAGYSPGWRKVYTSNDFSSTNISNWNTAYGWGNPSGVYLPLAGGTMTGALMINSTLNVTGLISGNGKQIFNTGDAWLRINENSAFTGGTYFGTSIVRTDSELQVGGSGSTFRAHSSVFTYLGNNILHAGNYGSYSTFSGAITGASLTVTGDVTAFSDSRVKENIRPIANVIERIQASRGVVYDRIDTKQKDNIGFIAQELEDTFPELVLTQEDGTKAVKYQNAVAVLFEAIKKQQSQIEDLKALVTKLINK
jgi:hypothetical protein